MASTSKDVKVEVTLNGSGFDTPSELQITEEGEIPNCSLTFPAGMNTRYKALKRDILRVYIGLDDVGEYPIFTGHLSNESSKFSTQMELIGSLGRAIDDQAIVNDYNKYEGMTVENAILSVFEDVSALSWMTPLVEQTDPSVTIPKGILFEKGVPKYDLMKQFRELAIVPSTLQNYTMFQHGDHFHFRKVPDPLTATPSITLTYGDSLLDFEPDSKGDTGYNYSRVIGKDGVTGEFQNDHRIAIDGLKEMGILSDDDVLNGGEAYETARINVLSSIHTKMPMNINSHLLLEAIPNYTVIAITGAPYGISDNYLIRSKHITVGESVFGVQCQVTAPSDILSSMMSQLLSLNSSAMR